MRDLDLIRDFAATRNDPSLRRVVEWLASADPAARVSRGALDEAAQTCAGYYAPDGRDYCAVLGGALFTACTLDDLPADESDEGCPECARSNGPRYRGPCDH